MSQSLTKNVLLNIILTSALYISQIITYPYISRVLGVEKLGECNFAQSFALFFTIIANLGIETLGAREIAKVKGDREALDRCFSRLFGLNAFTTLIALCVYLLLMFIVAPFRPFRELLEVGLLYVGFNFLIAEWFFRGMENVKYIAYRTIIIRTIYIVAVFLLIKGKTDYLLYFLMLSLLIVVNGLINSGYRKKFVSFCKISFRELFYYRKPYLLLGINFLLMTYYCSTTPILLQLFTDSTQVGYYTTATKLTIVILMMYNAYTLVVMPRISSLLSHNGGQEAQRLLSKSVKLLLTVAVPVIILMELFVPQIIRLVVGPGFEGAILPMRIALPVILISGASQITINQMLIPYGMDIDATACAVVGFVTSLILNIILIPYYGAIGAAISWLLPELAILTISIYYCFKHNLIKTGINSCL